jgi:hypothetical protein
MRIRLLASCTPDLGVRDLEPILLPARIPLLLCLKRPEEVAAPETTLD